MKYTVFSGPLIYTKRLLLRQIFENDITPEYIQWLNNSEVTKYLEIRHEPQTLKRTSEYIQHKNKHPEQGLHFGVFDCDGRRHIGTVTLNQQNMIHRVADISFIIGHPDAQRRGYGTEAVHGVVYFSFFETRLRKITGGHYRNNIGSRNVFLNNGFEEEGVKIKQSIDNQGNEVDSIIYGLHVENFLPQTELLGVIPPKIEYVS